MKTNRNLFLTALHLLFFLEALLCVQHRRINVSTVTGGRVTSTAANRRVTSTAASRRATNTAEVRRVAKTGGTRRSHTRGHIKFTNSGNRYITKIYSCFFLIGETFFYAKRKNEAVRFQKRDHASLVGSPINTVHTKKKVKKLGAKKKTNAEEKEEGKTAKRKKGSLETERKKSVSRKKKTKKGNASCTDALDVDGKMAEMMQLGSEMMDYGTESIVTGETPSGDELYEDDVSENEGSKIGRRQRKRRKSVLKGSIKMGDTKGEEKRIDENGEESVVGQEKNQWDNHQTEEQAEKARKIEFIKRVEFLLKDDEKNHKLYEEREDINKLRFGEKPPPGSEDLMKSILKNIHEEGEKKKNNMYDLRKKHLFFELLRISNSNSFQTHKIYTHDDLIYGMKYRKLGESNLCVSELCVGTSMYENENFISSDDVNVLLNMAFYEYGINFFDICEYDPFPYDPDSYKKSKNKNMNIFLKDKKRENVVINLRMCSSRNVEKNTHGEFYLSWIMEGLKDDIPTFYNIEERLDKILKNLNTNYVDILTIDLPERYIPNGGNGEDTYIWGFENLNKRENKKEITIEEQFEILERLILKGKVRHIAVSNESEKNQWDNHQTEEQAEKARKIEFIKRVEFLLKDDEKNHKLYEEREDINKLRFGEKPPPGSEDLMKSILKNIHEEGEKKKNNMYDLRKKHLFFELLRISNSNSFQTHKIYTHDDLIYGMKYRKLGESNLCVSELCVGTSMYENENFISSDDVNVLLNMAFYEYGINFFDICEYDPFPYDPDSYKKSKNKNMNIFLKDKKRENVVINLRMCSSRNVEKNTHGEFYLSWIMEGLKDDIPTFYNIEERLDKILKNLNTNYVDILTIDLPERYIPNGGNGEDTYIWGFENLNKRENKKEITIEEQFEILERLILKGKVRHIAVSNESVWGIFQWCNLARKKKKKNMKIVCVQNLYNLLHRNDVESSGLVEMILKENYNVPLVPYGLLAGGILTGKYLDPERYHTIGPETILGDDKYDHDLDDSRGNKAEDYGYLSYGPRNGRCNKYPRLYKSHRCVWAQDATGEYMKLARSHGMTLSQLSLSFVYSRPFVGSSIIGPRTIGQLKDCIFSLNYPIYQHTQCDIHEIFLRYRGCTMDGNTILNSLKDPNKTSQNAFYKTANIPILSGGTYWNNYPLPFLPTRYEYKDLKEEHDRMKSTFGLNDEPNDLNFISSRIWVEREKRKGEYFALKESVLFKWDKYKMYKGVLTKLSDKEKALYDTSDFHFSFKNNTISVIPTDEEIQQFYENHDKVKRVISQTINDHQELYQYQEQLGKDLPDMFNNLDIDLIYKQLINRHNINPLDKQEMESIYQYIKLTPEELKTEDFWYIYDYNPFDTSFTVRTGTEP
ncbi:oxidoreductase aldo/keto reductase domain containing protein [Plasmodium ovale curtisi]|uniref:Oxidoreductase aldo/keto reductase domain containing protein n=1 Tax=Plasmodium ovale curtisi TaxID=864141 RepID=A0A1A8W946_PLAOA|nr:oxidoreductase aldo/keto reductase domain containing protein [Plasmodium ovale curtisi]